MGSPKIGIAVASRVILEAKIWLRPATMTGVSRSGSRVGLGAFSCALFVAPFLVPFFCFLLLRRGVSRLGGHSCCLGYGPNGFGFLPGMSPVGFGVLFLFPSPPTSFFRRLSLPSPFPSACGVCRVLGTLLLFGLWAEAIRGFARNVPGGGVSSFFLPPTSYLLPPSSSLAPCGFRLQAARVGRMSWRWIRVAYQVARPAAIARSSCGYWPPWGRTAAISRSKMWACARDLSIRSNSVSSK